MKLLHTSDWHIGRSLYGKKRYGEMEAFLSWLEGILAREGIDALLVAGDVFDSATPSNRAQEVYYRFLQRAAATPCRHIVVIAGNHDSPALLDAPARLLDLLDIHVVGCAASPEEEVLALRGPDGRPELIVCAVPFLRDRDVRTALPGEDFQARQESLVRGIAGHYAGAIARARELRAECGGGVPIVVMGHLFTDGGSPGDGVRELYVGSLARVGRGIFPPDVDYVALGHLHVPQGVDERARYSGSPIPMGFGEAGQRKSVCVVGLEGAPVRTSVRTVEIPVFQELERLAGDWDALSSRLAELRLSGSRAWLEAVYDGDLVIGDLRERLMACIEGTDMELLCTRDMARLARVFGLGPGEEGPPLDQLSPEEVFERCLDTRGVPEEQRMELRRTYEEALSILARGQERDEEGRGME